MANVRTAKPGKKATRIMRRQKDAVLKRHVRGPTGRDIELFAVDSNDDNFDSDLTRVFKLNISRVREANTTIFGSPDGPGGFLKRDEKASRKLK